MIVRRTTQLRVHIVQGGHQMARIQGIRCEADVQIGAEQTRTEQVAGNAADDDEADFPSMQCAENRKSVQRSCSSHFAVRRVAARSRTRLRAFSIAMRSRSAGVHSRRSRSAYTSTPVSACI